MTTRRYPGPDTAPYRNGNLLDHVPSSAARDQETATDHYDLPDEWRPNNPFYGTLVLTGTERGRSAARFTWTGTGPLTGYSYPMFMTDAADLMMQQAGVANAVATGWWVCVKRGSNYGLMRLRPEQTGGLTPPGPDPAADPDGFHAVAALDSAFVDALYQRADPDGYITITNISRTFRHRDVHWIRTRLRAATTGSRPLPGVAVKPAPRGKWALTFARHCPTCDLFIPDGMPHPPAHTLTPGPWEQ